MSLKKYLLAGGLSTILILGACDEGATTENSDEQAGVAESEETTGEANTEDSVESIEDDNGSSEATEGETEETESIEEDSSDEENSEDEVLEIGETVADDEQFGATLVEIRRMHDDFFDEEIIEVIFDVENRGETAKEVQARSIAIDGRMVDEMIYTMSQEVTPGNSAEAVLTLQDYEGGDLPELTGNFEMILHVFDWDNYDNPDLDYEININLDEY